MGKAYYVAGCVFTAQFPQLSAKIQRYVAQRHRMPIVRCCIPNYKLNEFEEKMPPDYRPAWSALADCAQFAAGDTVYSLCHNCANIIEETKPGVRVASFWELILEDEEFPFPHYDHVAMTVQDCWRAKDRLDEQKAVRALLEEMNVTVVETEENYHRTDFCGTSLFRPQPERNPKLAPLHYVKNARGKFLPHTAEEQERIMREYCGRFETEQVVCYCHYCLEGLLSGGVQGRHLAQLLFDRE